MRREMDTLDEKPVFEENGIALFSSDAYAAMIAAAAVKQTVKGYIDAHLRQIAENDYFGLLAYVEMNAENEKLKLPVTSAGFTVSWSMMITLLCAAECSASANTAIPAAARECIAAESMESV